ncbi:hypothetical protein, conserved [Leishmania tarentolae]|uniref:Uncharacterized protein n=1 Tax=Leishmania tarentolae TaxID=5689 RepID=A0A640KWA8_LEITA|nr:hypothetical protein, conserved [Leishmania tarentolae]
MQRQCCVLVVTCPLASVILSLSHNPAPRATAHIQSTSTAALLPRVRGSVCNQRAAINCGPNHQCLCCLNSRFFFGSGERTRTYKMVTSSPSSSFFESLLYSRRGTGKKRVQRSLARRLQELGAQLCGRLSQIVLEVSPAVLARTDTTAANVGTGKHATSSPLVSSFSSDASAPLSFMAEVHRDLSAHYGSHAVRRGLAKPLGPCVHAVIRKGNLATQRAGVHSPWYMRLWLLRLVRRYWCPRCGVWLTRGGVAGLSKLEATRTTLATIKECRVRRQIRPSRLSTTRGRFMLCCLRCLDTAQRAAKRNAKFPLTTAGGQQQNHIGARDTAENASRSTQYTVREACAAWVEKTSKAVLADARVPRRNRRCHRRSKRRCQGCTEEAKTRASVTLRSGSGNSVAVPQQSTSASPATEKLALSLMRKMTSLPGVSSTAKTTKASEVKGPTTANTAQKSLQGLVPSGPLRKSSRRISAKAAPQPRSEASPTNSPVACKPNEAAIVQAVAAPSTCRIQPSLSSSSLTGDAPVQIAEPRLDAKEAKRKVLCNAAGSSGTHRAANVSVASFSPSRTALLPSRPLPSPPVPPTNAAKKAPRPPAKAATGTKKPTTAKKQFMDTMNQLGF